MDILDKILDLIKKRGLTDSKFLELAGLNKAVLFDWRSGKTKSYMKHLPKIANVLDTSVDYLLGNEQLNQNEYSLTDKQKLALSLAEYLSYDDIKNLIDTVSSVHNQLLIHDNSNNMNFTEQEVELIQDWRRLDLNGQFEVVQALNTAKERMEFSQNPERIFKATS